MDQAGLPMTARPGVCFGLQRSSEVWKIEGYYGPSQSGARVRPEPLI